MNNSSTSPVIIGAVVDDDNSSSATVDTLCEQNHGTHTILPAQGGSLSTWSTVVLWDCQDVLGIDPFASGDYKAAVTSNPNELSNLIIWGTNFDATSGTITCNVEMEQTVIWSELATPTQS